eukprot:scpid74006/ scgid11139/ Nuclear factor NF-kappa-B p105 subunit; Nuclear factor of kappa light polypeptide gene enhancer in B-cells 1; Nuclear factor NF-kappa-B p50 subunit
MDAETKHHSEEDEKIEVEDDSLDDKLAVAAAVTLGPAGNGAVSATEESESSNADDGAASSEDGQEPAAATDLAVSPAPATVITPYVQVDSSKAELTILEEPRQRGFRFRYSCEGPSHGGLPGETSEKNRKSYPTVQLRKYEGRAARVVVSLVTQDDPPRPHAHSLVGRHVVNGQCTVQIGPETNWMASFPNLGILHVTKKNVVKVLLERYALALTGPGASSVALPIMPDLKPGTAPTSSLPDEAAVIAASMEKLSEEERSQLKAMAEEASRHMNLSVVRLCFQAYLADEQGSFTKPLQPCISQPVYDSKAPSASTLKISRMDRHSGSVLGGDEVYLLCDRVQKDDIEVRFFTEGDGSDSGDGRPDGWSALGVFAPSDVHRQFAIVFKTPAYCDTSISRPVNVWIQLRRRSDNETSEAKPFTYQPQIVDTEQLARKRQKKIPHFFDHYGEAGNNGRGGGGGNGSNGGGGAAGGGGGGPMWGNPGSGGGAGGGASGSNGPGLFGDGFGFNGMPPLSSRQAAVTTAQELVSGDEPERAESSATPADVTVAGILARGGARKQRRSPESPASTAAHDSTTRYTLTSKAKRRMQQRHQQDHVSDEHSDPRSSGQPSSLAHEQQPRQKSLRMTVGCRHRHQRRAKSRARLVASRTAPLVRV